MKADPTKQLIPVDLIKEYAEIGVDKLVEESKQFIPALDSLGSELPSVNTLIAAIKFPRTLSDYLLGRKVNKFLYGSGLNEAKIEKFKKKFSKTKQERLWERVTFSLNAHDDKMKSQLVGKLFAALIDDLIDEDEFFAMVHATNALNIHTIDSLKELYSLSYNFTLSSSQSYSFATLGLIDIDNSGIGAIGGGGPRYPLNQLGWKYTGIVFDFPPSRIDDIKIGEEILIAELDENSQLTNHAYPLRHIIEKGSRYREVNVFAVTQEGSILCDTNTNLPTIVAHGVVPAGVEPNLIAERLVSEYNEKPLGILLRQMEDSPIQKWAFIVKTNKEHDNSSYRSNHEIRETVSREPNKTDETRYISAVVDQIVRHTDGELRDTWHAQ